MVQTENLTDEQRNELSKQFDEHLGAPQKQNEQQVQQPEKWEEVFKKEFPDYESPEKLKSSLNEYRGKIEKLPEYENEIKTLKESRAEFANDKIKHWNELAKKGINFDKDFFLLQDMDVDKMANPVDVVLEAQKRNDKSTLTDDLRLLKIRKKYDMDSWANTAEDDLTDDDKLNRAEFMDEVEKSKEFLKKYKSERAFLPPVDEAAEQAMAKQRENAHKEWEGFVDKDVVGKIPSFETEYEDKDTKEKIKFEYKFSDEDKKEMSDVMKNLPKNINVYFEKYLTKDKDGNVIPNHIGVGLDRLKAINFDKAVKAALQEGIERGKFLAEKSAKNVQLPTNENGAADGQKKEPKNRQEALEMAVRAM